MPVTVRDRAGNFNAAGIFVGVEGLTTVAMPDPAAGPIFILESDLDDTYYALKPARRDAVSDVNGYWQISLPKPAEQDPTDAKWRIQLSDGTLWEGTVPTVDGTYTVKQLKDDHGWERITDAA